MRNPECRYCRRNPPIGTVPIPRPSGGGHTRYCPAQTPYGICKATTREGKEYCPNHVDQHDYVSALKRRMELSEREQENTRAQGYQAIQADSIIAKDILSILETYGPRTIARLAREVIKDLAVVERYVEYLYQQELVELGETRRGAITVRVRPRRRYR